jgi:recombination protein RecT
MSASTVIAKPSKGGTTFVQLLDEQKEQIALALPKHLTADRVARMALTTFRRTPELHRCNPLSLFGCVMQAAQIGLEIDGTLGHCYMVPFKQEAQLIVGYKGYIALAYRSGLVSRFSAHVVHANDQFDFQYGSHSHINHKPSLLDPGEPIAVYAVLEMRGGTSDFEVIGWPKILECQKKYGTRNASPWNSHLEEMARKTAIRALAKRAPLSSEFGIAAGLEAAHENDRSQNLAALVDLPAADKVLSRISPQGIPEAEPEELPAEGD